MARDLFKRYIWLVDTIYQARRITLADIIEKWERSSFYEGKSLDRKTFMRHRKAIQETFDITIPCDKKDNNKYYIENSEEINKGTLRKWLLSTITVNNIIDECQQLRSRIQLEDIPSGQLHLTPLIEAMRSSNTVEITYQSYWREHTSTFEINPYFLKIFKQRWYVVAYSEGVNEIMIYALDRIVNLATVEKKFIYPADFNPEEYFNSCYGIINDEKIKPQIVKIKVDVYQARYLRGLPLHHSQKELETTDAFSIFEYYIKPTFDFKKELLSMGAQIEIIEPECLKESILEEIEKMRKKY